MPLTAQEYALQIDLIRAEMTPGAPYCPTCGTAAPKVATQKACTRCRRMLPIGAFGRHFDKRYGRSYPRPMCRACDSAATKRRQRKHKVLRILGRAS